MPAPDATPKRSSRRCMSCASPSQTDGRCCCTHARRCRHRSRRRAPTRRRLRRTRICAGIRCAASGWRTPVIVSTARSCRRRVEPAGAVEGSGASDRSAGGTVGGRGLRESVSHADAARTRSARTIVQTRPGCGACEVVVFTQDPSALARDVAAVDHIELCRGVGRIATPSSAHARMCSTCFRSRIAASRSA